MILLVPLAFIVLVIIGDIDSDNCVSGIDEGGGWIYHSYRWLWMVRIGWAGFALSLIAIFVVGS